MWPDQLTKSHRITPVVGSKEYMPFRTVMRAASYNRHHSYGLMRESVIQL